MKEDLILAALRKYKCQYTLDADGNPLDLVDVLSTGQTISEGVRELELLAEHIADGFEEQFPLDRDWAEGVSPMKMTHTNRGFAKIEITDTRGCICRVQRSSAACVDAVWIFCDDPDGVYRDGHPSPHLDADQAREVARALLAFADNTDSRDWCDVITDAILKELMAGVGMPNSISLMQALRQCDMEATLREREACAKIAERYEPDEKQDDIDYASREIRKR